MTTTLSVIIPALNEAGNIAATVDAVRSALGSRFARHEILIIDDGSTDATGTLAAELAAADPSVRVIANGRNRGLGYSYRRGVELAQHEYVMMVPGDNEIPGSSLADVFEHVGRADLIVPHFVNREIRPMARRLLSRVFTGLVNALFGLRLSYFNGPCVLRRALALPVLPETSGFAYMAVILVRLIASGATVVEVGTRLGPRNTGKSKALRFGNWVAVGRSLASLFVEIHLRRRRWPRPAAAPHSAGAPR